MVLTSTALLTSLWSEIGKSASQHSTAFLGEAEGARRHISTCSSFVGMLSNKNNTNTKNSQSTYTVAYSDWVLHYIIKQVRKLIA